jgi:putative cardiolipin synthase
MSGSAVATSVTLDEIPLRQAIASMLAEHPEQTGVRLVPDGAEAFALRVLSARIAQHTLDVQYYIWRDDSTGCFLLHELLQAADRGVQVRILLDDMYARPRDRILKTLDRHPRVDIRLFNPFATRSGTLRTIAELFSRGARLNHRMHNKAWIVDGCVALMGGRNVGDEYFSAAVDVNFIDLDALLIGPGAQATHQQFEQYWDSELAIPTARLHRSVPIRMRLSTARRRLERRMRKTRSAECARLLNAPDQIVAVLKARGPLIWTADVQIVADDPRKALGDSTQTAQGVFASLRASIHTGRELRIISPYFVPGAGGTAVLRERAQRGAQISILTNSLAATDVAAVHSGYSRYRKALLAAGIRLFELKPSFTADEHPPHFSLGSSRGSLHTKAMVVGDDRAFVGSFNLDPRSMYLNCELGVWITGPEFARGLIELFEYSSAAQRSYTLSLNANADLVWMSDMKGEFRQYSHDPDASWTRRIVTALMRLLPLESQL